MTDVALTLGSFLVAFGPLLGLFILIVYQKAQLVILVTTAAFFFLLAATTSSVTWYLLDVVLGLSGPLSAILPSILFQFIFRCAFTALYHKVERVIQLSLQKQKHEEEVKQRQEQQPDVSADAHRLRNDRNNNGAVGTWTEAARLRLELNDSAAAVASAVGFGGMHAIVLYGTLFASEVSSNVGVLFQDSCPKVPSLAVSALMANMFSILQVFWMLLTFFGMRRRLLFHRGQSAITADDAPVAADVAVVGGWLGNSRSGGNWALLLTLLTHTAAALVTTTNGFANGCRISLPSVGGILLVTAYLFWAGCSRIYLPPPTTLASSHPPARAFVANEDHQD